MDDFQKLMRVEQKLNEITTLIHEHFQSCLLSMNNIHLKSIAQLTEDNFQDFQQRREYTGVVKNLESHSIRISSGIKEQIQHIQDLKKRNDQLKNELERERYLNLKYRQGLSLIHI